MIYCMADNCFAYAHGEYHGFCRRCWLFRLSDEKKASVLQDMAEKMHGLCPRCRSTRFVRYCAVCGHQFGVKRPWWVRLWRSLSIGGVK